MASSGTIRARNGLIPRLPAPSGLLRAYKSRHEIIRLHKERAGWPQSCPSTPVLDWMKPVIRPTQPELLAPPDAPAPCPPIWTPISDGNPLPREMDRLMIVLAPDGIVPIVDCTYAPPVR